MPSLMSGIADVEKLLKCFEARETIFRAGDEVVGYGDRASIVIITEGSAIAVSEDHLRQSEHNQSPGSQRDVRSGLRLLRT